jgi:hypothetical protein
MCSFCLSSYSFWLLAVVKIAENVNLNRVHVSPVSRIMCSYWSWIRTQWRSWVIYVWQILSDYFWSKLKALKDQCSTWIQGLTIAGSWKSNPYLLSLIHRVGRELSFFSSRRNWDSPNPSPAGECAPTPLVPGGAAHSLAREGVGESQFQRGYIHCGTRRLAPYF